MTPLRLALIPRAIAITGLVGFVVVVAVSLNEGVRRQVKARGCSTSQVYRTESGFQLDPIAKEWVEVVELAGPVPLPDDELDWLDAPLLVERPERESCTTCGGALDSPPCCKSPDGVTSGHTGGGGCEAKP